MENSQLPAVQNCGLVGSTLASQDLAVGDVASSSDKIPHFNPITQHHRMPANPAIAMDIQQSGAATPKPPTPADPGSPTVRRTISARPPPSRVLVADDNVDLAEMTALLLRLAGYDVRAVHDGAQAVEVARTFMPAVAILDINMPTLDGWATARALRAGDSRIALIAMTALSQPADFRQSLTAGFDEMG
jgi:CheY-like chemotaxis protein